MKVYSCILKSLESIEWRRRRKKIINPFSLSLVLKNICCPLRKIILWWQNFRKCHQNLSQHFKEKLVFLSYVIYSSTLKIARSLNFQHYFKIWVYVFLWVYCFMGYVWIKLGVTLCYITPLYNFFYWTSILTINCWTTLPYYILHVSKIARINIRVQ